jgi:hypothetical protein
MAPDEVIAQGSGSTKFRRAARWTFVDRRTGAITIAQWPNVSLSVFIALSIAQRFFIQRGTPETTLRLFSAVPLIVWAADEFVRGVNPFRRFLGLCVLLATVTSIGLLAR